MPDILKVVYGIKNCNTVKSALAWLTEHNIDFVFHDYKSKGIAEAKLREWTTQVGWESLVNKRGTTWRHLSPETQQNIRDEEAAIELMKEKTSVIKRPLIEAGDKVIALGFDQRDYEKTFRQ